MHKVVSAFVLLAAAAATATLVHADAGDPPSRVARLNLLEGPVSFRPGSVEEWGAASLNYPLTIGDHLWADAGARAELHIGSTAVRMDSQTALTIVNLDDRVAQISLTAGSIDVRIRYVGELETYEIDTPNAAISLLRPGDYRITADGDHAVTIASVRAGQAEVTGGGTAFPIRAGESASITGTDQVSQEMGPVPPLDDFDQWAMSRDRREASMVSARYVPREMIGYEDLDQYGTWGDVPGYGWCWTPTSVAGGWAPYRYGHWVWINPWGWTWVDDAPWGFAPFHYGRWAFAGGAWIWAPGRLVVGVRPVYAPALVAFVGGPGFGIGVGVGGGVGLAAWFPLGPGEVYRPAYHVSNTYVQNINIVHVTNVSVINQVNVTNVRYANQNVNGAVTAVPQNTFAGARPVAAAAVPMGAREMAGAQVVGAAPRIAPTRASLGAPVGPAVTAPPARFASQAVVTKMPPPAARVPFAAQQQALHANPGQPVEPAQVNTMRGRTPATPATPASAPPQSFQNDRPPSARPPAAQPQILTSTPPHTTTSPAAATPPANNTPQSYERPASAPPSNAHEATGSSHTQPPHKEKSKPTKEEKKQ